MERQVQLKGTSEADSNADAQVELFDNGVSLGFVPVSGGVWEKNVSGLEEGAHSFIAKTADGTTVSDPWALQVERALVGVENFDSLPDTMISVGQSIVTPMMVITFLEGEGNVAVKPVGELPLPGKIARQVLHLHIGYYGWEPKPPGQTISMKLGGSCSKVSFWYRGTNEGDHQISFYNVAGLLLGTIGLLSSTGTGAESTFSAVGIREIVFKTARADWFLVDTFTFE
ncbi:MAG: hypothetical protein EOP13_14010 [Pseudomonas sp.]|uniref:hypothetical protein n=1 Tax=Pseudomonas sp. TaxID=306 RepID=UPI0011FECB89|nr:hypothetical protein [Pseudomonas sp.]RZI72779.1 MAG: hypothetical protein EOP13_14010 [Pseudomonas sp.]